MKLGKKLLALLLAAVLCFSLMPTVLQMLPMKQSFLHRN